jgi:hypothetical protein
MDANMHEKIVKFAWKNVKYEKKMCLICKNMFIKYEKKCAKYTKQFFLWFIKFKIFLGDFYGL